MKVIKLNKVTNEAIRTDYPRLDKLPIEGLRKDYKYYVLVSNIQPIYNYNTHKLVSSITYQETNNKYPYLGTAIENFELEQLSNNIIINNLNNSLGRMFDIEFPAWKKAKYLGRLQLGVDYAEEQYIKSLLLWDDRCRTERDNREKELINNNIIPSFDWELKPIKP